MLFNISSGFFNRGSPSYPKMALNLVSIPKMVILGNIDVKRTGELGYLVRVSVVIFEGEGGRRHLCDLINN